MSALLLDHAPTQNELVRLYYELASVGASSVGERRAWRYAPKSREELIALASQMMRYDPRHLSVLVQWLRSSFQTLNPLELRRVLRRTRWPQSMLVAFEFARLETSDPELAAFADYVEAGWPRVQPAERFFLDTERPGSRSAARNLGRNLAPYARWGYIGQERPIVDPISKRAVGRYDIETRKRILRDLLERRESFSTADYLHAIDHSVSRQQALADLKACEALEQLGRGRGAHWRRRARRRSLANLAASRGSAPRTPPRSDRRWCRLPRCT